MLKGTNVLVISFSITSLDVCRSYFGPISKIYGPQMRWVRVNPNGGAAGYRPRVQSAYYKRVYRYSWQASTVNIGVIMLK